MWMGGPESAQRIRSLCLLYLDGRRAETGQFPSATICQRPKTSAPAPWPLL